MKDRILIGITGGIGSGKSLVSAYLSGLGEDVIYSDRVSRQVVMPGEPGNSALRQAFGDDYFSFDGTLERQKLARHVFNDKKKLELLNSILHPIIIERIYEEASRMNGRVFIEVPLLIQTGMHKKMDYVWLVVADLEKRVLRIAERDGLSATDIKKRVECQLSDSEMARFADEVIDNSGTAEELYRKIETLLKKEEYSR